MDTYSSSTIYVNDDSYDSIKISIPLSQVDTIMQYSAYRIVRLKEPYVATLDRDSMRSMNPMVYVDNNGKALDMIALVEEEDLENNFPYFDDYTFKGIFPDMTSRQKWIDFFHPLIQ